MSECDVISNFSFVMTTKIQCVNNFSASQRTLVKFGRGMLISIFDSKGGSCNHS